ncbi:MAG: formate dehydrogenase accessory sulfurtransferase FdhD [Methanobacteriota archaeon]
MNSEGVEYTQDGKSGKEVILADEEYVTLYVNSLKFARIFATPENLAELATGFLVTEGVLEQGNIQGVKVEGLGVFVDAFGIENLSLLSELRSSGCSGVVSEEPKSVESGSKFRKEIILASLPLLDECSPMWRVSGGTHTTCLIDGEGNLVKSFEDIGRHNALDKVIGWSLQNELDLSDKFILFSGRISLGIVYKCVRAEIPLLVSKAAGLSKAVEAARKLNLTTAGFARKGKFTVYANEWRIV